MSRISTPASSPGLPDSNAGAVMAYRAYRKVLRAIRRSKSFHRNVRILLFVLVAAALSHLLVSTDDTQYIAAKPYWKSAQRVLEHAKSFLKPSGPAEAAYQTRPLVDDFATALQLLSTWRSFHGQYVDVTDLRVDDRFGTRHSVRSLTVTYLPWSVPKDIQKEIASIWSAHPPSVLSLPAFTALYVKERLRETLLWLLLVPSNDAVISQENKESLLNRLNTTNLDGELLLDSKYYVEPRRGGSPITRVNLQSRGHFDPSASAFPYSTRPLAFRRRVRMEIADCFTRASFFDSGTIDQDPIDPYHLFLWMAFVNRDCGTRLIDTLIGDTKHSFDIFLREEALHPATTRKIASLALKSKASLFTESATWKEIDFTVTGDLPESMAVVELVKDSLSRYVYSVDNREAGETLSMLQR